MVAGSTPDLEIRVRFSAYPRRVGHSDSKDVKYVFRRPGASVGVGPTR